MLLHADIDNYASLAWNPTNLNARSHKYVCVENNNITAQETKPLKLLDCHWHAC